MVSPVENGHDIILTIIAIVLALSFIFGIAKRESITGKTGLIILN
ncbi:hypothetical protein [Evansella cellulosilytica]|uniref:Uncharacterized protein n=1 Tax=Evansella cellulosilytica (strain ATCC 21833 / DSM 2522 / FERM P-1141 / JCM 9156 / N-4) TaxID=649639 RepID=E6TYP8_EVAC2|nr:hypothetical protein [Evansella cellulosilytica]ADU30098.1 hypothetical protein Bcell_1836 [Evansella cellulosilytica DSM 2522]